MPYRSQPYALLLSRRQQASESAFILSLFVRLGSPRGTNEVSAGSNIGIRPVLYESSRVLAKNTRKTHESPEPGTQMNRYRILLAITSLALFAASVVAHAEPEDVQAKACRGDALRFCLVDIPHKDKITDCMKRHMSELSPRCRAMFHPSDPSPEKSDE